MRDTPTSVERGLRGAGVAILAALAVGAAGRAYTWFASGLVASPVLGGVTSLVASRLPSPGEDVIWPLLLIEVAVGVAVAIWAASAAVRLVRRAEVSERRRRAVTTTLLVLGVVYPLGVLAVLPWSGLKPGVGDLVVFCAWSVLDLVPIGYAAWAVRRK